MKFPKIEHVYIVHCDAFTNRKEYMMNNFIKECGLTDDYYTFMVNTHKDSLTNDVINQYYSLDMETRMKELKVIEEDKFLTQEISKGAISCGINHYLIWKEIVEKKYTQHVLILEDDAITIDNFLSCIVEVCAELTQQDIVSIENGANLKIQKYGITTKNDQWIYKCPDGRMRCTGAYLIHPNTCRKLIALHKKRKFSLEIDMQMWLYSKLGFYDIYWSEPTLFSQGSQNGLFPSQICPNFSLMYKYILFMNKKCVCMGMTFIQIIYDLVVNHNCSALFYQTTCIQETPKYPIKVIQNSNNIPSMIKNMYFDGQIDVFAYGLSSSPLLKLIIFDTLIINPSVIICSDIHKELLSPRYKLVNDCVFVRHSQVVEEEKNEMEFLD